MKEHPCPANGKTRGACPGYVVERLHAVSRYGAGAAGASDAIRTKFS
jgi:hypothetical protein